MSAFYRFSTQIRVRYIETDLQGHINFVHHFTYFGVGITEYLRHLDFDYYRMLDENLDMLFIDAHASFNGPAFFDELIRIHCRIGHIGNTSLRFDFQVVAQQEERLVSTGEVTAVMADKATRKKTRVPDRLRQLVAHYENDPDMLASAGTDDRDFQNK
jgi:acyl-CoA thioester hydrolase